MGKRAAARIADQLSKHMARKLAEENERRNRPPEDEDDEPKAMIVQMPEAYIPEEREDMYD